jgi:hypothetical protein
MAAEGFAYAGKKSCGCIVTMRIDHGDSRTAKDVAKMIRDGLTVERMSIADWRKAGMPLGCTCKTTVPEHVHPARVGE